MTDPDRGRASAPSILIVGTGFAARIHSRTLGKHHRHVQRFYLSRSPERALAFAAKHGGSGWVDGWSSALQDDAIDAVLITTPPDTHLEFALEALAAGKHVIVEKPAFTSPDALDRVESAARGAGRQVMVAENYAYKPLLERIRRVIASGTLGQVRFVQLNAVKRQLVTGWRSDPDRVGGGALLEGGIHWISFMTSLGLQIRRVEGYFPDAPPGHERSSTVVAEYEEGAVGVLNYSWEIPGILRGLRLSRIWGTRASLLFESNGLFLVRTGNRPAVFRPALRDLVGYRAMMADFVGALETGDPPQYGLAEARRDLEIVWSAYASGSDTHKINGNDS